jgi:hypothetical protein
MNPQLLRNENKRMSKMLREVSGSGKGLTVVLYDSVFKKERGHFRYCIEVPAMKIPQMVKFAQVNMLPYSLLLIKARKAHIPSGCAECGVSMKALVKQYKQIPSEDRSIDIEAEKGITCCIQLALGRGDCRTIRDWICKTVHEHLIIRLARQGFRFTSYAV